MCEGVVPWNLAHNRMWVLIYCWNKPLKKEKKKREKKVFFGCDLSDETEIQK